MSRRRNKLKKKKSDKTDISFVEDSIEQIEQIEHSDTTRKRKSEEIYQITEDEDDEREDEIEGENSLDDFIEDNDDYRKKPSLRNHLDSFIDESEDLKTLPPEISKEYENIKKQLNEEIPTVEKIMKSKVTQTDKKECLKLFKQLQCTEGTDAEYYRIVDSINDILNKAKFYSPEEIHFLENEENKLKNMYTSNDTLKTKILKLEADDKIKSKILAMYEEMLTYPPDNTTYSSLREKIEWCIRLPYQKREIDPYVNMKNAELNQFYTEVRKILDDNLYGMEKVKERILHVLNDRRSTKDSCGRNIALCGPPGTGKSEICKVLAKILGKKFGKISAASLDNAAIKGTNQVWIGSAPSIILQTLSDLKTNNAVMMIDEAEKMDIKSQQAFLHASDAADNKEFQDNYLNNFSHDLSKVFFVFNMNTTDNLDPAFLDRLDIIYVDDYTNEDKLQIFKNYMLPKTLVNIGMKKNDVVVLDSGIKKILEERSMGLRTIEKLIKNIVGKVNMYKNSLLPDGTLGNLNLSYKIPNFKLPLKIDYKLLVELGE